MATLSISERSRLDLNGNPCTFLEVITSISGPSGVESSRVYAPRLLERVLPGPLQRPVAPHRFAVVSRLHLLVPLPPFTCGANNLKGRQKPVLRPLEIPRCSATHSLVSFRFLANPPLVLVIFLPLLFLLILFVCLNAPWMVLELRLKKYLKV